MRASDYRAFKEGPLHAVGEPKEVKISGQTFFRQDLKGRDSSGTPVFQSSLFTVTRGYALGFICGVTHPVDIERYGGHRNKVEFY